MWSRGSRRRLASVQEILPLEEISGDVVCLRGGDYRCVLEASSVHFALKSEPEQEAILAGYRRFLNGLTYPLQVLVRVVPADIEAYLAGLGGAHGGTETLRRLALDHEAFVRRIARERTLLDRRFFVVLPAGMDAAPGRAGSGWSGPGWPWRRGPRARRQQSDLARARRTLSFRCGEVAQGLGSFGVSTRRLGGGELAALWRDVLGGVATGASGHEPPVATPVVTSVAALFGHGRAAAGA